MELSQPRFSNVKRHPQLCLSTFVNASITEGSSVLLLYERILKIFHAVSIHRRVLSYNRLLVLSVVVTSEPSIEADLCLWGNNCELRLVLPRPIKVP